MIEVVLVVLLARLHQDEGRTRVAGGKEADLARGVARGGDEDELLAARPLDGEPEHLVLLLEDHLVLRRPEEVPEELVRALGLRVLGDVEERLPVAGPDEAVDAGDALGKRGASLQILHVQVELAKAGLVGRVGQERAVVAGNPAAQPEELLAGGKLVEVEDHQLGRVGGRGPAAEDGVLLPLLGARVIGEPVALERHVLIGLLDAREHLAVERLAPRLLRRRHRLGVGVLGAQVLLDLGRALVAQPEVVVDALVAVDGDVLRLLARDRRPEGRGVRGRLRWRGDAGDGGEDQQQASGGHGARR